MPEEVTQNEPVKASQVAKVSKELQMHEAVDHEKFKHLEKRVEALEEEDDEMSVRDDVSIVGVPTSAGYDGNGFGGMGMFGGLLIGALLGRGGFGFGAGAEAVASHGSVEDCIMNNQNLATIMGGITNATNAITSGQRQDLGTIMSGQQAILAGVNNDTLTTNLAICNQGDRLSTLIGEQAGSIRAEISDAKLQSAEQYAAVQLTAAQNTFALSRQMCDDAKESAAQFAALSLQACQNQNALQMQIAECCCETQTAIAAANTARIQDELDALRLERALANSNGQNGQVINQIAVSLGAITQTLAALQTKLA